MAEGKLYLLLDLRSARGPIRADDVTALVSPIPGVVGLRVFPELGQAEVVLDQGESVLPDRVAEVLRGAGYSVQASMVPDPAEDSAYARYYHAPPDSAPSRWVD
jgi:copper chaperone CopZ